MQLYEYTNTKMTLSCQLSSNTHFPTRKIIILKEWENGVDLYFFLHVCFSLPLSFCLSCVYVYVSYIHICICMFTYMSVHPIYICVFYIYYIHPYIYVCVYISSHSGISISFVITFYLIVYNENSKWSST